MSDTEMDENLYDSDQEVAKHHSNLVEAVTRLDKRQRVKKAERSEPSLEVSEYHLVKSGVTDQNTVHTRDLIKHLEQKGDQSNLIKKLRYIQQKNKVLAKPLEKPAAERIKRTVGYDKVKGELDKWNSVITRNRTAEHLVFPLKHSAPVKDAHDSKISEFLKGFSIKSDLMKKFEQVDPTLLYPADKEEEKGNKYKMTLEEVILRRKEAARFRAQQSYKEAKAHRQRKIKSKKFHRIQRKDKIKQQLKDFEKLKDSNPEEALAKLEQLDKTRAEERMSLKHKNTGQWARNKQIKAKYNKETRQILSEQLAISKELTQKVKRIDSSDEDEDEEDEENMDNMKAEEDEMVLNEEENNVKTESEINDFIKLCRKYYDKKQQKVETNEISNEIIPEKEKETSSHNEESNTQTNTSDKKNKLRKNKKSTLKANKSEITSKLCIIEKGSDSQTNISDKKNKSCSNKKKSILQANTSDTKGKSCSEENNTSLADTSNTKVKVRKEKRNKESSIPDCEDTTHVRKSKKENSKRKLNPKVQEVKKKFKANEKTEKDEEEEKENENDSPSLEFEAPKRKPILNSPLEETTFREHVQKDSDLTSLKEIANSGQKPIDTDSHEVEIDPKKYVNIKPKHLMTHLPDVTTYGDEDSDQEEETHKIMSEAFADDDVVEEFRKEKEEEMKKSQPQSIDLSLPGWGSWGGPNINKSKIARKKSRFILTVPKVPPRKPENQGEVIVFEHENENLRKHLVKELPHPFTRVKDFEAIIRAPVSRTFVPMNAHVRLIQPTVKTKLGQIINPMDENELLKKQPIVKKPLKRMKNDKKNAVKNNDAKNNKEKKAVKNNAENKKEKNTVKHNVKNDKKKNTVKKIKKKET
ncbi:U3 small nucleolar RNA-associated protein 14 homolog A [Solenopsis invicta]|uniref:U3 small nucleolar RNA-associated protein 14 homolog A n=1 Tax=Solenopsis invicta TaxID=13686 RepID=UPI000595F933|nr:U3 small nucleolar RNA-associated protein 14 homolog A [Solenopsis invicta]